MKKKYIKVFTFIMALIFVFGLSFSVFDSTAYARGSGSTSKSSTSKSSSTKSSTPTSGYKSGSFSSSSTTKSGTSSGSTSSSTSKESSTSTSGYKSGSFSSSSSSPTTSSSSTSSPTTSSSTSSSPTANKPSSSSTSSTTTKPSSDTSSSTKQTTNPNNTTKTTNNNTTVVNNSSPSYSSGSSGGSTFIFFPHRTVTYDSDGVSHTTYTRPSALGYVVDIIVILIIIALIIYFIKRIKSRKSEVNKMSSDKFLELELDESKRLYSEVIYALDEIGDFVPQEELKKRRYVKFLPTIKTYADMVEKAITEEESKSTFSKLFSSNRKSIDLIEDFKQDNEQAFKEIKNCMNCKCFKCVRDCKMEGCNRCEAGKGCRIESCDNKTNAVYTFKNKKIKLMNNNTGEEDYYNVLAIIQDIDAKNYNSELPDYGQLYIIIELDGQKYTLYFYPGISDDEYGEITDVEDFNFASQAYENLGK